jgi:multidrug efflux pump subunit AcrA (membrane-fusion protein)
MRFMVLALSGLWLVLSPSPVKAETAIVKNCVLVPDEEAQVPAQEAGVLTKILVREGETVVPKQLLAQIDDLLPRMQREVAGYKLEVATKKGEDDVDIRFADAAAKVAKADYLQSKDSNEKVKGTVTQSEVRRQLLDWHKMELSIEKAMKDQTVSKLEAKVAAAELHAAEANVERRQISAPPWVDRAGRPLEAIVVELTQHVGQWVQIGEPVMRLVRMDRLRVNGVLDAKDFRPSDIQDQAAQITVTLPRVGRQTFSGRVVYVKPVIEGGTLQVRAEVENRKQGGIWILNPGMNVEMTVQLK